MELYLFQSLMLRKSISCDELGYYLFLKIFFSSHIPLSQVYLSVYIFVFLGHSLQETSVWGEVMGMLIHYLAKQITVVSWQEKLPSVSPKFGGLEWEVGSWGIWWQLTLVCWSPMGSQEGGTRGDCWNLLCHPNRASIKDQKSVWNGRKLRASQQEELHLDEETEKDDWECFLPVCLLTAPPSVFTVTFPPSLLCMVLFT